MGLDAHVNCNCYELGRLREPPPVDPQYIKVMPGGYLDWEPPEWEQVKNLGWGNPAWQEVMNEISEFDHWNMHHMCEHFNGVLLHHWIGNMAGVGGLQHELNREAEKFPIILEKIIYSGTHCGDWLPLETVNQLKPELEALANFQCADPKMIPFVQRFHQQMVELLEASLSVGKPICF